MLSASNKADKQRRYRNKIINFVCRKCGVSSRRRRGVAKYCDDCGLSIRLDNLISEPTLLTCQQCGIRFKPENLSRKFCSLLCKGLASRGKSNAKRGRTYPNTRRAAERKCMTCETVFRAVKDFKGKTQLYCTHRCYLKNRRVSHFENRVMAVLRDHGLELETTVKCGRWTYDAQIVGSRILIEADGLFWHSSDKVRRRDRLKDAWCSKNGYILCRVLELDFYRDPEAAIDVILKRAEAEGLTCELSD